MLVELLKRGLINKEELLLKNYKKIGLTENQVVIIMLIIKLGNEKIMTASEISNYMSLSISRVEKEIDSLISKNYVKVNSKSIDFTALFVELATIVQNNFSDASADDFLTRLNKEMNVKLTIDEINYLDNEILSNFSKIQILELAKNKEVDTFEKLKNEIKKSLRKKTKPITKYNWLDSED